MLDLIREIGTIIGEQQPRTFVLLVPPGSKLHDLYQGAMRNDTASQIAFALYGTSPSDKRFLMLRKNLLDRLMDVYLSIDRFTEDPGFTQFQADKFLAIATRLLSQNYYHNAEKLAKKAKQLGEKYGLIETQSASLKLLHRIKAIQGDISRMEKIQEQLKRLHEERAELDDLQLELETYQAHFRVFRSAREDLGNISIDACAAPLIQLHQYTVQAYRYLHQYQPNRTLQLLEDVKTLTKKNPELSHTAAATEVLHLQFIAQAQCGEQVLAEKTLKKLWKATRYEDFSRYDIASHAFDFYLRQQALDAAKKILLEVLASSKFEALLPVDKAAWLTKHIFWSSYCCLKQSATSWPAIQEWEYQNYCTILAKDKCGYNVQYRIARFLFRWCRSNTDLVAEGENLKVYYQRHLKNKADARTRWFVKALANVLIHHKNPERIALEKEKLAQRIAPYPHFAFCEIIPYPNLLAKIATHIDQPQECCSC